MKTFDDVRYLVGAVSIFLPVRRIDDDHEMARRKLISMKMLFTLRLLELAQLQLVLWDLDRQFGRCSCICFLISCWVS